MGRGTEFISEGQEGALFYYCAAVINPPSKKIFIKRRVIGNFIRKKEHEKKENSYL